MTQPQTFIQEVRSAHEINEIQELELDKVYTKTELLTPGKSFVNWANIIGAPTSVPGDVAGPVGANDREVAIYSGVTGKVITGSGVTLSEDGSFNIPIGQTYDINGAPHVHPQYEPVIVLKRSGYNLDIGTDPGTICAGDDNRIHIHPNGSTLGKLSERNGEILFNGQPIRAEPPDVISASGYQGYIQINDNGTLGGLEPKAAFNKDFGTTSDTVSRGNHSHSGYEPSISKKNAFNKDFGSVDGTVCSGGDIRLHTHDNSIALGLIQDQSGRLVYNGSVLPITAGDINGPDSSVTGHIATYADATGKLLQDGGALGSAAFQNSASFVGSTDSRLSDTRTPKSHGSEAHSEEYLSEITYDLLSPFVGTESGSLAEGDHTHSPEHAHVNKSLLDKLPSDTNAIAGQVIGKLQGGSLGWVDPQEVTVTGMTGPEVTTINHVALFADVTGDSIKSGGPLGGAAFKEVGTNAESVAAGNHTHSNLHSHSNTSILGNLGETGGKLTYRGVSLEGGEGTVISQSPVGVNGDIQINDNGYWGSVSPKTGFNRDIGSSGGSICAGDDYRLHSHTNRGILDDLGDYNGYLVYNGRQLVDAANAGDVRGPAVSDQFGVAIYADDTGKVLKDGGLLGEAAFMPVGDIAGTVCAGDDSRLYDTRTPKKHGDEAHTKNYLDIGDVTYANLALNGGVGTRSNQVSRGDHSHNEFHSHANKVTLDAIPDLSSAQDGQILSKSGSTLIFRDLVGAEGDVKGPDSVVANSIAIFADNTGKEIVGGGILGAAAFKAVGLGAGDVAAGNHGHSGYEPAFNKNNAFNKNFGTGSGTICEGNDSRIHTHGNASVLTGLVDVEGNLTYNGKVLSESSASGNVVGPVSSTLNHVAVYADISGKIIKDGGALGLAAFMGTGSTADTVCIGNDSRLSNARTPVTHGDEAHSTNYMASTEVNFNLLNTNGVIGTGANQIPRGNHTHPSEIPSLNSEAVGKVLGCIAENTLGMIALAGGGDVLGPNSAETDAVALFSSSSGKMIKAGSKLGNSAYKDVGDSAGTVCSGNDSRLSDDRYPVSHDNSAHSVNYAQLTDITYDVLNSILNLVGMSENKLAPGDHTHTLETISEIDGGLVTIA